MPAPQIIYIGEKHNNKDHVEQEVRIIADIHKDCMSMQIALEAFSISCQATLDEYTLGQPLNGAYYSAIANSDYKPILEFAMRRQIKVIGFDRAPDDHRFDEYLEMFSKREKYWIDILAPQLGKKSCTIIIVGANHLRDPGGLHLQLARRGYDNYKTILLK